MFNKIKTGVIGVGSMGQHHARIYADISNLVGVSDLDEANGRRVSETNKTKYYQNYYELFEKVDAISLAVPTHLHKKISQEAFQQGISVLVEKPLAGNALDAKDIVDQANSFGVTLAVGQIERFNPVVQYIKKQFTDRVWKSPFSLTARRFSEFPVRINDVGVLFDLTIHDVDILRYITGSRVISVCTFGGNFKNNKFEDFVNVFLKFENGAMGLCQTNWLTPGKTRQLDILASDCHYKLNLLNQQIQIKKLNSDEESLKLDYQEPLKSEIENFLTAVSSKEKPSVSGEDGLEAVKIVEAALLSLNENRIISLQ